MPLDTVIGENRESFSREIRLKIQIRESFFHEIPLKYDQPMVYFFQVNRTTKHGHQNNHPSILPAFYMIQSHGGRGGSHDH